MKNEIRIYRKNSVLFLFMTIVLAGMVILLVDAQGGKQYPGFTIYAAALYMFYKMGAAIAHLIKERNRKSPVLMILRKVGYIDACVSMLTLQTAMFAAFGGERWFMRYMNGISGIVYGCELSGSEMRNDSSGSRKPGKRKSRIIQ